MRAHAEEEAGAWVRERGYLCRAGFAALRGRPPLVPLALEAAALAGEVRLPRIDMACLMMSSGSVVISPRRDATPGGALAGWGSIARRLVTGLSGSSVAAEPLFALRDARFEAAIDAAEQGRVGTIHRCEHRPAD